MRRPAFRSGLAVLALTAIVGTAPSGRQTPAQAGSELQAALARLVGYVASYRAQYSLVVADEDYRQEAPGARVRMRSDLLLVKTAEAEGWVSFRDVYELDGLTLHDRDDRLKKLFLDPTTEALAQLQKIKDESARYNIGDVVRNVNVPFFPLVFLDPANVPRFQFTLGGRRGWNGVRIRELRYEERQSPTIVLNARATGWYLVDEASGAIVQTGTTYSDSLNQSAEIVVQYAFEPALRVWVPTEMNEVYRDRDGGVLVKGTATYSKFRRFQVSTDEKITIIKSL